VVSFALKKRKSSNDILEIHFVSIQRPRDICMQWWSVFAMFTWFFPCCVHFSWSLCAYHLRLSEPVLWIKTRRYSKKRGLTWVSFCKQKWLLDSGVFFFFSNLFYILNEVQIVHLHDAFLTHVWTSLLISIAHTNSCLQLQPLRKGNLRNMLYVRLVSQGHNYIQIHNRGKYCVGLHICHFT